MKVSSDLLYQNMLVDLQGFLPGSSAPDANWRQYAALALRDSLLKKYTGEIHESQAADKAALELFLSVNEGLLDRPREPETLLDQHLLGELKGSLYRFWHGGASGDPLVTGLHDLFLSGRVGPGSSLGCKSNNFYTKLFSSNLTTTSPLLYKSYRASAAYFPLYDAAEKHRAEYYGDATEVTCSKLLFVPKRYDISRTICVEPNLNMFYQLGFAGVLESQLRKVFAIDLSKQPDFNRELARRGSVDGSYATIDLSSASDSLSIGVLRDILPRGLYSWCMSLRTPSTQLPDGRTVPLRMVSTMGNGFTFPLETLIFAAVVSSAYRVHGEELVRNDLSQNVCGNFAVFGDDIIVRTEIAAKVLRLLHLLGFTVNRKKTFVEGPFRESCGSDWFKGRFVRGVYIKSLKTPQDRYVAINSLNDWSACTGILLQHTVRYLLKTVKWVLISPALGLDQGIHVPLSLAGSVRRNRNGSFVFPYYTPRPLRVNIAEDGSSRLDSKGPPNHTGLELAFIAGYVRSSCISLRQREVRYSKKNCVLPFWDNIQIARSYRRFCFARWETAVYLNMLKSHI